MKIVKNKIILIIIFAVFIALAVIVSSSCNMTEEKAFAAEFSDGQGLSYTEITGGLEVSKGTATAAEIIIPESYESQAVIRIANNAFENYTALTNITIPSTVTAIGANAFNNCTELTKLKLNRSISDGNITASEGLSVFSGCTGLLYVYVPSDSLVNYETDGNWSEYADIIYPISDIIITAGSGQSKIYGADDPAYTYETSGTVTEPLSGVLTRGEGENNGTYDILQGTLTSENNMGYSITFIGDVFTIDKKNLVITAQEKTMYYSGTVTALTYSVTGLVGEDTVTGELSRVAGDLPGTYAINIGTLAASDNYIVEFAEANYTIQPGIITGPVFTDYRALYDGTVKTITASGNLEGLTVSYSYNTGTNVGIYQATAQFEKEYYTTITLSAKLIIMTKTIETTEETPEGIITFANEGVDPDVSLLLKTNIPAEIQDKANSKLEEGQSLSKIINITLYKSGNTVQIYDNSIIKILLPDDIENTENLRLIHISETAINDMAFTEEDGYIIIEAEELGYYAFITAEVTVSDKKSATILTYASFGIIGLIFLAIIFSTVMIDKKRRKVRRRRHSRYA